MKVCVLSPSYDNSNSVFCGLDPACNPAFWMKDRPDWTFDHVFVHKATAVQQVRELAKGRNYDCFVNLCDGAFDEDRAGIEVVKALELFKVPFTGADSRFYEPSKELMKMVATYMGVKTPAFVFAFEEADILVAGQSLRFPVIVKHFNGYSSVGMTAKSRCIDMDGLLSEARRFIDSFGGALIEEFIEGREATVMVVENSCDSSKPIVLQPVECLFPPGESFKHFDLKWCDYDGIQWKAVSEPELDLGLRDVSRKIFSALGGVSYGRCDLRIQEGTGDIYFLEINPNCGVFYPPEAPGSADCILQLDPMRHEGFIELIVNAAIARQNRLASAVATCVRYHPRHGYCLQASRDIAEGEIVMKFEEKAQFLVTKGHVERHWDETQKRWFCQYAWPLSEHVYVMWSDKPEEWRPINHSCDPNSWFAEDCGFDLVARRPIRRGEEITMDYATFCCSSMEDFDCSCQSPVCRGRITGSDCLNEGVVGRYGTHTSDFVRTLISRQKQL